MIWDNGNDFLNRSTGTWDDTTELSILFNAVKGIANTLPDSTTDSSATSQNTSAYLFHKLGTSVTAQSIPYLLNGNTLSSIKNSAGSLVSTSSYSMASNGTLTFTSTYLSTFFSSTTAGIKDTLTLTFSAGASLPLQIVQYSTPTVPTTTYTIQTATAQTIPITYSGLPIVAAVKALNADGTYMVSGDDWTQYLGPLQQARWTYGDWTSGSSGLTIDTTGMAVIAGTGQNVVLTLEFYPRSVGANSVNVTFVH